MKHQSRLCTVNSLWIGPRLEALHAACLNSFLRHGHRVVLHVYEPPEDVPAGVELCDAARLMKPEELRRDRWKQSYALSSDIYRYRLLRADMGAWVDTDVFCVRPLPEKEYLFGWENDTSINGAVLKMPAQCSLLEALCQAAEDPAFIPYWLKPRRQAKLRWRKRLGIAKPVTQMPWGTIGPRLLTHLVAEMGLGDQALPIDFFYPLSYGNTNLLFEPGLSLEDITTHRTVAVHLWNSLLRKSSVPARSPLAEIIGLPDDQSG